MSDTGWREWRAQMRRDLLVTRRALDVAWRADVDARLFDLVRGALPSLAGQTVGLYWPVRGEPDLRAIASLPRVRVALPVARTRGQTVEFHAWRPGAPLRDTGFGVKVPAALRRVSPDVLLVPLLGFDDQGYRLGYGSGYYDRTLAVAAPRPFAVGVGYEVGRLPSIFAQAHDQPMDLLITETGVHRPQLATRVIGA